MTVAPKRLLPFTAVVGLLVPVGVEAQSTIASRPLAHFVYVGMERNRLSDPWLSVPAVAGVQIRYTWKQLEPERDRYDFDLIRHDIALLAKLDKKLFIQLQDVSFYERIVNVPDYLREDAEFSGGVALKYEFAEDDETQPRVDGWVARRWDSAVRSRLAALLRALAAEFDGRIAGLNLAETSIGFGSSGKYHPPGFSYDAYFDGIIDIMSAARSAFDQSDVIIYANFMPGEELPSDDRGYLRGVYRHADEIGMGVGGPDILPHRWYQRQHSLPLIASRARETVAGMAVQDGNLADTNRRTGKRVTIQELAGYARDELHLDYIFWGTEEPYFSEELVPFLRSQQSQGQIRSRR